MGSLTEARVPMIALRGVTGRRDSEFEAFVAEHPEGAQFPIDPAGVADFKGMISVLQRHGAEVVIAVL
jgi:hypothetical protein